MKSLALVLGVIVVALLGAAFLVRPSNARTWASGQERMPRATFDGARVTVHDIRNFSYAADGTPAHRYENRSYDLDKLNTVWFVLAPFSRENRGPAHTFLSFGFADSQYLAVSVEARRELGEDYSILKGMLRRYEIMYVIGDERDLIGLRTNVRGDDVFLYPVRTTPGKARELFVQMLQRANKLYEKPEFYNTVTNNCTTNILRHVNSIAPHRIPYGKEVLLPGYADELAARLGLIDSDLSVAQARARFHVNERARRYINNPNFSQLIRNAE